MTELEQELTAKLDRYEKITVPRLLRKLAIALGLNDSELWWLIDRGYKIDDGEYKRLRAESPERKHPHFEEYTQYEG